MKYEAELGELKNLLSSAQNILITLPQEINIDKLATGLAIGLSLEQMGKKVDIVTEGVVRVEHTSLFGVDRIKNKLPEGSAGDFIIILGGVANPDGTVPAAEKVDYFPSGSDLNLVFRVKPGHKFEPTKITTHYDSGGFDLIFTIGSANLESIGSVYTGNQSIFQSLHLVNINNQPASSQFAAYSVIDPNAASLSEMVSYILQTLGLPLGGDIATNILSGIFAATNQLQDPRVNADTYAAVAEAVRAGGQKLGTASVQPTVPLSQPVSPEPAVSLNQFIQPPVIQPSAGFDLSKVFQTPIQTQPEPQLQPDSFTVPPVVPGSPEVKPEAQPDYQPSSEETPRGEAAVSQAPEADWLTPKIFKGSSVG